MEEEIGFSKEYVYQRKEGQEMSARRWKGLTVLTVGIFALITLGALPLAKAASEVTPFITLPAGGTTYVLGAGIVSLTNKYMPELNLVHETAQGAKDTALRMMYLQGAKKGAFGLLATVDGWNAYKGKNEYAEKPFPDIRAVVVNNLADVFLVVPANSPIKSFADVRGKRIGVGTPGSSMTNIALLLFEYFGITTKDFKPYYYMFRETIEGIQDGSLDGGFLAGMYPVAGYTELATRQNVRIVSVDENILKKLISDHPYFYRNVLKAKSYKGMEQDITVIGFTGFIFTHAGVSSDYIYKFIKNLFDHRTEYYGIHKGAKVMTPENAILGNTVPLHPGAEKYYKEIGVIKK